MSTLLAVLSTWACSHEELLKKIEAMAESKKCSAAQLSLAWHLDAVGQGQLFGSLKAGGGCLKRTVLEGDP